MAENPEFRKRVKFVFANEKAYKKGERYVDDDLNRVFPGYPESSSYEERLASEMMKELKCLRTLDLHESSVSPTPFSLFCWMNSETADLLQTTGVEKAVEISYTPGCGINNYGGVEVETGPKGTKKSEKMAYRILKNFLAANDVIDGDYSLSDPELYTVYSSQKRPEGEWETKVGNFQKVEEGETLAVSATESLRAQDSFIPVLFAEDYDEIFGFKAVRLEKVEDRIFDKEERK